MKTKVLITGATINESKNHGYQLTDCHAKNQKGHIPPRSRKLFCTVGTDRVIYCLGALNLPVVFPTN